MYPESGKYEKERNGNNKNLIFGEKKLKIFVPNYMVLWTPNEYILKIFYKLNKTKHDINLVFYFIFKNEKIDHLLNPTINKGFLACLVVH